MTNSAMNESSEVIHGPWTLYDEGALVIKRQILDQARQPTGYQLLEGNYVSLAYAAQVGLRVASAVTPSRPSTERAGPSMRSKKPVCPYCGSDNVVACAAARWDLNGQEWDISNVFDKGHDCEDCDATDIEFQWVSAVEPTAHDTNNASERTSGRTDASSQQEQLL